MFPFDFTRTQPQDSALADARLKSVLQRKARMADERYQTTPSGNVVEPTAGSPFSGRDREAAYSAYGQYLERKKIADQYNHFVRSNGLPLPPITENEALDAFRRIQESPNTPEQFLYDSTNQSFVNPIMSKFPAGVESVRGWDGSTHNEKRYLGAEDPFEMSRPPIVKPSEFFQRVKQGVKKRMGQ